MGASLFIAKMFGIAYIVISIGFLFNQKTFRQVIEDFCNSPAACFYGGLLALTVGLAIILTHNTWGKSWVVIITLIGWSGLIKGIWMIVFPDSVFKLMKAYLEKSSLIKFHGIFALVFGITLTYFGFKG